MTISKSTSILLQSLTSTVPRAARCVYGSDVNARFTDPPLLKG